MPAITFISSDGVSRTVDGNVGYSLMETARNNDIPGIDAECGGMCACATCHVYIDARYLPLLSPRMEDESALLEFVDSAGETSRLSCQVQITPELDGLVVTTPESQS